MSDGNFEEVAEMAAVASSPARSDNSLEDKSIVCIGCAREFVWTAGEQAFFRDKHLQNPPKRCKACKKMKNERLAAIETAQATGQRQRIEVAANCAKCGETTTVPFYPSQGRPVYCRACYIEVSAAPDAATDQ